MYRLPIAYHLIEYKLNLHQIPLSCYVKDTDGILSFVIRLYCEFTQEIIYLANYKKTDVDLDIL